MDRDGGKKKLELIYSGRVVFWLVLGNYFIVDLSEILGMFRKKGGFGK